MITRGTDPRPDVLIKIPHILRAKRDERSTLAVVLIVPAAQPSFFSWLDTS